MYKRLFWIGVVILHIPLMNFVLHTAFKWIYQPSNIAVMAGITLLVAQALYIFGGMYHIVTSNTKDITAEMD